MHGSAPTDTVRREQVTQLTAVSHSAKTLFSYMKKILEHKAADDNALTPSKNRVQTQTAVGRTVKAVLCYCTMLQSAEAFPYGKRQSDP
jgi:hypothetical protein